MFTFSEFRESDHVFSDTEQLPHQLILHVTGSIMPAIYVLVSCYKLQNVFRLEMLI